MGVGSDEADVREEFFSVFVWDFGHFIEEHWISHDVVIVRILRHTHTPPAIWREREKKQYEMETNIVKK